MTVVIFPGLCLQPGPSVPTKRPQSYPMPTRLRAIRNALGKTKRTVVRGLADVAHNLVNAQESALPPPSLRTVGGGDFSSVGVHNVRYLRKFTELDGKNILEIGCGSGRNALALRSYDVSYYGFDIFEPYISWCSSHITRDFPNFRFQHANIYNGVYNPSGKIRSEEFSFPLENGSMDVILLTSVFTHLLEPEAKHYIKEIARLLKPGGAVYATFFLLNDETNRLIREGKALQPMTPFGGEGVKVGQPHAPEAAIAFAERLVRDWLSGAGLEVSALLYGSWSGRAGCFDYQDVVFAVKRPLTTSEGADRSRSIPTGR